MSTTVSFANQKGGVGKTTSAINVSAVLGDMGYKVLLCDFDPQGNATTGLGIKKRDIESTVFDLLFGSAEISSVILSTKFKNLSLIPSSLELATADLRLSASKKRESVLREELALLSDSFDYIIIDCPPSLGMLTINALCASDYLVIPMQSEYFALEGLSQLSYTYNRVKTLFRPSLELAGILFTMYDGRLNLSIQVSRELQKHFPGKVFVNTVPRSVRVSEAPSHGLPLIYYDKACKAAKAYVDIATEFLKKAPAEKK